MAKSPTETDIAEVAERFKAECEAFAAENNWSLSTFSQKALKQRHAIERMPRMQEKLKERMARVRKYMVEVAAQKAVASNE